MSSTHACPTSHACRLCAGAHGLVRCASFKAMSVAHRNKVVKALGYCTNCLAHSHVALDCSSTCRCKKCGAPHHTLLHVETAKPASSAAKNRTMKVVRPQLKAKGKAGTTRNQARRRATSSHASTAATRTPPIQAPAARMVLRTPEGLQTAAYRGKEAFRLIGEALWTLAQR